MKSAQQVSFAPDMMEIMWSARQGELQPACLVKPTSTAETASILVIVQEEFCPFSVFSGGHARFARASNSDGGVTISLENFNDIAFANDEASVWIGAGLTWKDVYPQIETRGKLVLGGRVESVGVGGLLLGGGISWLSGTYGWACDRVLAYEIVLASGQTMVVDRDNHADLFRALKGSGAANFGIVTRFQLQAFDWPSIYFHGGNYNDSHTEMLLDAKAGLLREETDPHAAFLHSLVYLAPEQTYLTVFWQVHTSHGTIESAPSAFSESTSIEAMTNITVILEPYSGIMKEHSKVSPAKGKRQIFASFTHRPSRDFDREVVWAWKHMVVPNIKDVKGLLPAVTTQKIWPSMMDKKAQGFWDVTGMDDEDGPLVLLLFSGWTWDDGDDDDLIRATARDFIDHLEERAEEMGLYHPFKYINYLDSWQDPWEGWKAENLKWLRGVQRRYDPDQVFTKGALGDGHFKLNRREAARTVPKHARDEL